ncbi:hypothetical protein M23134_06646 [Microscilla marina ATCC 23134]|uniref:Uncharacterized protein n=2 Tax=Microscilla marina TaxID=1027 RepID=A1ZW24_MICM2|nr:hypothetical protein M23134_06646 [Microscilla marina ATCC 23134]
MTRWASKTKFLPFDLKTKNGFFGEKYFYTLSLANLFSVNLPNNSPLPHLPFLLGSRTM